MGMKSTIDRELLARLWDSGLRIRDISDRMGHGVASIRRAAEAMGLTPRPRRGAADHAFRLTARENRDRQKRVAGDILRRARIVQPDPVILKQSGAALGLPIRVLNPETRALIDVALAARTHP